MPPLPTEVPAPDAIHSVSTFGPVVPALRATGTSGQIVTILRHRWNERHANVTPANNAVTLPRYEEGDDVTFMNDVIFAVMHDTGIVPMWNGMRHTTHERFLRYLHDIGRIAFAGEPPIAYGALAMSEEDRRQYRAILRRDVLLLKQESAEMPGETWL